MIAGMERSKQQLELASEITNLDYDSITGALSFRVQNNTGHKLLSGFPEGRRAFINIKTYNSAGLLLNEVNPYDGAGGTLKGLHYPYDGQAGVLPNGVTAPPEPADLGLNEVYVDELVYEAHTSSFLTGEEHTFHFALATDRYKDNRIPPKGFRFLEAQARLAEAKWHNVSDDNDSDTNYFTAAEYAGGYDAVSTYVPPGAVNVQVNLYYQTTSREYVEFLRNEVNGGPVTTLIGTGAGGDPAYIIQSPDQPFFAELKGWGDALWGLWVHNMNKMGAAPFLMAQAVYGTPPEPCAAPAPSLLSTDAASGQVTLIWSDESADPAPSGYSVYYDQAGKSQFIVDVGLETSYTDAGLTNGQQYCYKVTSYYTDCESDFSIVLCATPEAPGQGTVPVGVDSIDTGYYTGKGKNQTFVLTTTFVQGDEVTFQAYVVDNNLAPVEGATVDLSITGPSAATVSTGTSNAAGMAEGSWKTTTRKGGTPLGTYTATTTSVTATGYEWDRVATSTTFDIQ
jgi:hypothetical protein